jgi:hypothetical protein
MAELARTLEIARPAPAGAVRAAKAAGPALVNAMTVDVED